MFVLTAKVSKTKLAAVAVFLLAVVVLIVMLCTGFGGAETATTQSIAGDTEDARLSFIAQYGWDVSTDNVQIRQVVLPKEESNEVFVRYNELQKSQGFDLTKYAGKNATQYVYEVLNAPDAEGPVHLTLLVCEGKIIGGDVTDTAPNGLMHGFARHTA